MLLTDLEHGVLYATGIVGGGLPIALGAGLGARLAGRDRVALTFFGDGATNQGTFHETFNMSGLWNVPCVFFCENNLYAEMTPTAKGSRVDHIADRGCACAVPGVTVDGNDVEAVYEVTRQAVDRARQGEGPTLIEAITYRLTGHMFGDTQAYRPKGEMERWRAKDPLIVARRHLSERHISSDIMDRIDAEVEAELERALAFARSSPQPVETEATTDVYV
jgi:pyruvate dehydrogenase E1 component alpha subunit